MSRRQKRKASNLDGEGIRALPGKWKLSEFVRSLMESAQLSLVPGKKLTVVTACSGCLAREKPRRMRHFDFRQVTIRSDQIMSRLDLL